MNTLNLGLLQEMSGAKKQSTSVGESHIQAYLEQLFSHFIVLWMHTEILL